MKYIHACMMLILVCTVVVCHDAYSLCEDKACEYCRDGRCRECKEGYYIDVGTGRCNACAKGCVICRGKGRDECMMSDVGYYTYKGVLSKCGQEGCYSCAIDEKDERSEGWVCNQCEEGYRGISTKSVFGSDDQVCEKCKVDNCDNCDAKVSRCDKCKKGYLLKEGVCVKDENYNCKEMDSYLNKCKDCDDGYSFSYTRLACVSCPSICSMCNEEGVCDACRKGYYFNQTTSTCSPCMIDGCTSCRDGPAYCERCVRGQYFDVKENECKPCDATCAACNGPYKNDCTVCNPGYLTQSVLHTNISDDIYKQVLKEYLKSIPSLKKRPTYMKEVLHPFEDVYCVEECFKPKMFGKRYTGSISTYMKDRCTSIQISHRYNVDAVDNDDL